MFTTREAAQKLDLSDEQFRRFAKKHGVSAVKRNTWNYDDIARLTERVSASLLKERGWTKRLIERFADPPDELKPNPKYKSASPMRLYRLVRIIKIENSEAWKSEASKSSKRRESADQATKTKFEKTIEWAKTVAIEIAKLSEEQLEKKAIEHFNSLKFGGSKAYKTSDRSFLERIKVNYLRHCGSEYENMLDAKVGRVGCNEAYLIIKERVFDEIAKQYPYLADECFRQGERTIKNKLGLL